MTDGSLESTRPDGIAFIGAGPGDPELLTVRGQALLETADLVVYAGSLVNSQVIEQYCQDVETVNSADKELETLVEVMATAHDDGQAVVRVHSGDPSIYGAVVEQMAALESRGIETYLVPGVTAAFAAAATIRTQLTLKGVANHVVFTRPQGRTLEGDQDHLVEFLSMDDVTVCLYLGTHAIQNTMDRLIDAGIDPELPVTVVYHASWPDEDILHGTLSTIGEQVENAGYRASAIALIGEVVRGPAAEYDRSALYGASDVSSQTEDEAE